MTEHSEPSKQMSQIRTDNDQESSGCPTKIVGTHSCESLAAIESKVVQNVDGGMQIAHNTSIWKSPLVTRAPYIVVNEGCERLAFFGMSTNIIIYMTRILNLSNARATAMVQIWSGTCYATPVLGAFIADAYWGRYWTIIAFSFIYMLGLLGVLLSASIPSLTPEAGQPPSRSMLGVFWTSMYLVALGTGGIKPCVSVFGAEQFDLEDPYERSLIPRFFNWFFFGINIGSIIACTVVVNIQTNISWAVGFAIPLACFVVATGIFVLGTPLYRRFPPSGSPFTRMFRVMGGAVSHRKAQVPEDDDLLFEVEGDMSIVPGEPKMSRTASFKWLEKAAVQMTPPDEYDPWLTTLTEVEDLKCVLRLMPTFFTFTVFHITHGQMLSLFILQGETMDTSLGGLTVAAATVSVLDSIATLVTVVIYDLIIDPYLQKIGLPLTTLQRIGIGYFVAFLALLVAGILEVVRLDVVHRNGLTDVDPSKVAVPLSVWWQTPQYVLIGISVAFSMVAICDLFYTQAPPAMRSTCSALQLLAVACGRYLGAAVVGIVQAASGGTWIAGNLNQGHLDDFFWALAGLQLADTLVHVFIARRFRYRDLPHAAADVEAMVMAATSKNGLNFSMSSVREYVVENIVANEFLTLCNHTYASYS